MNYQIKAGGKTYETMARELSPDNIVIKNFDECLFYNKKDKNIALIFHIDYKYSPLPLRFIYPFLGKIIFRNLKKFNAIVVCSKYWEKYFKDKGYQNVHLIYNAFDLKEFVFPSKEIKEFKERYNFTKPIVYLGNCQKAKGVVEAYKALKDLDVHLVTSGKQRVKLPILNLELNYRDYLRLLKASEIVITMSKFKEGWCRTAHEAMLCKTPVIGSGLGGMKELLEGGEQRICNFKNIKKGVTNLLLNYSARNYLGQCGYNFAEQFTLEKFEKSWLNLIKKI